MAVALYIRVSTEEQAREGYSIQAQRNKLEAYCVSQGWDVVGFYIDDGYSAKDLERPEMKRMLKHIEQGLIDCVLVYRLDRLTRSVLDLYKLLEVFEKHNCKFKSATEVYDTTSAMGRMFITIVAAMAQWERENLAERVRMGMQEKARQGKWVINVAPYGYDIDRTTDTLVVNQQEAVIVRKIYDMYLSGMGMHKIALSLNNQGTATKSGAAWTSNKVKYVLTNPLYIGTMRYNYRVNNENYFEVDGAVPAIISEEVFERAQKIIEKRKTAHPRSATSEFVFSGVAKCARCGAPLAGKYGFSRRGEKIHRPRSYYCTKQKIGLCDQPNMSERFIEQKFLQFLKDIEFNERLLSNIESGNEEEKHIEERREWIQTELKAIEKRRVKWQYAWANDTINDDDFKKRMKEENEKEEALKKELEQIQPKKEKTSETDVKEVIRNIIVNWSFLEAIEKKTLLQMVVKKLVVDKISSQPKVDSVKIVDIEFY
ncbi:Integrase [Anoxybacillus flavithermus]|uniref:recombinase family protein n=1 Tax=Anoxybacillus flavithermus TaxID=33934 RepID=UPI0007D8E782|nr:recombinase family protein [Anoxybacillus flavithermus]OAO78072.1 Integrase [Anoxybacillus flavithermus]